MRIFSSLALLVGLSTVADAYGCPGKECRNSASSYCSSYMKVPKKTTTVYKISTVTSSTTTTRTKGTKTITVAPTTVKTTETVTSTETKKTVIETDTTTTITVKPTCSAPSLLPGLRRRSYPPSYGPPPSYGVRKPDCFSRYQGKKAISSACKCVGPKPSATTVFRTFTRTKKVTSTTTVNKSTVTETPTVTEKSITTAPPTTTTETETKTTKTESTTVTSGRPVLPTGAFNIVLGNPQPATPPNPDNIGAVEGLRAVVGGGETVSPIEFISPAELGPTTFSLNDNGNLFSEGQTLQAFISNTQGNNPQQLSFQGFDGDGSTFPEGSSAVFCEMLDNGNDDNTCEISCGSSPGETPQLPESRSRKRQIIIDPGDDEPEPEPIPSFVVNPLSCGLTNTYFLGDGEDFESGLGACIQISAFVVPAAASQ
ncbi:hypothetical protein CKM354_000077600 [Cercospora kikuchii]|uniref:Uncharacterized protein n=1 Tax=Cercospora kikuchii TaxID=84275 RepID=A0A9P3C9J8_9PEZI|nr:uncharacterized protein CKM354_000077600 [Cercospora kikuchii]GIZ37326.1 hypothetical protein CKM354_000077600 [Cercospora kikuchii]